MDDAWEWLSNLTFKELIDWTGISMLGIGVLFIAAILGAIIFRR